MQDFLVMEKDLSRIVAKAGIEVPEASETEMQIPWQDSRRIQT